MAQVMRALPAAGLAGLLAGGRVSEGVLAERLDWCRGWTQEVAGQDSDPQCQMLAAGCQSLQVCRADCSLAWLLSFQVHSLKTYVCVAVPLTGAKLTSHTIHSCMALRIQCTMALCRGMGEAL